MTKNHHLAQSIGNSAWNSSVTKLEYKAAWFGKTILKIGHFEPPRRICNNCGFHNSELSLNYREWKCPECKANHDRDIDSAINIKKFSLQDQNMIVIWHLWNAGDEPGNMFSQKKWLNQEASSSLQSSRRCSALKNKTPECKACYFRWNLYFYLEAFKCKSPKKCHCFKYLFILLSQNDFRFFKCECHETQNHSVSFERYVVPSSCRKIICSISAAWRFYFDILLSDV